MGAPRHVTSRHALASHLIASHRMTASSSSISTFELSREYERLPPTSRSLTRPTHFSPISREVKTRMDAAAATCSFSSPKVPIRRHCACVRVCVCILCVSLHMHKLYIQLRAFPITCILFSFFPFLFSHELQAKDTTTENREQGERRGEKLSFSVCSILQLFFFFFFFHSLVRH